MFLRQTTRHLPARGGIDDSPDSRVVSETKFFQLLLRVFHTCLSLQGFLLKWSRYEFGFLNWIVKRILCWKKYV